MIFRREFDSDGDASQRARCAAELRVQVIRFAFRVAEARVGVLIALLMMIFRRGFAERGCRSEELWRLQFYTVGCAESADANGFCQGVLFLQCEEACDRISR